MSLEIDISPESYLKRIDTNEIRQRLEKLVPSPEYWRVFRLFIHGKCERAEFDACIEQNLKTNEQKHVHNELIKGIIFNAHYSAISPKGFVMKKQPIPKQKPHIDVAEPAQRKTQKLKTYLAADLHAIPSIVELQKKLEQRSRELGVAVSRETVSVIHAELKRFIFYLLENSLSTVGKPPTTRRTLNITTENVKAAINMDTKISSIVSSSVLSRFSTYE